MNEAMKTESFQSTTVVLEPLDARDFLEATMLPHTEVIVGRASDTDIHIDEPMVSRRHCRLTMDDVGRVFVEDLASHNGTAVNDQRIEGVCPLRDGDELWLGIHGFTVRLRKGYQSLNMTERLCNSMRGLFIRNPCTSAADANCSHESLS